MRIAQNKRPRGQGAAAFFVRVRISSPLPGFLWYDSPMHTLLLSLCMLCLALLVLEKARAVADRKTIGHVIHVNGTRGKTATTRLIDAALREAGFRVFTKTTGTVPQIIGADGTVREIRRRGNANIKEQLHILRLAAKEHADILCVECMALAPEYQFVSQHRMLQADIGVITNVRRDHTEVMGETIPEIAAALSNTVPENGVLFSGEGDEGADRVLASGAQRLKSRYVRVHPASSQTDAEEAPSQNRGGYTDEVLAGIDWPDNVRMALAVASSLGVDEETALRGMRTRYRKDPYALAAYRLPAGGVAVNALSANDVSSIRMAYETVMHHVRPEGKRILLLHTRADRAVRTIQMAQLADTLLPDEIWLTGQGAFLLSRSLKKHTACPVRVFRAADAVPFSAVCAGDLVFAAGNIKGEGEYLAKRMEQEGEILVL